MAGLPARPRRGFVEALVEYRILGPLEVRDGGTVLPLGGPRHRTLLAMLLVHAGQTLSTGRLIEALWGQAPPRSAVDLLYVRMSELRGVLRSVRPEGAGALRTHSGGYRLEIGPDELDAGRFERLTAEGRRVLAAGDADAGGELLRQALRLWRGPALADVADQPFAQSEIARLENLRAQALEDRLDADLAAGRHAEVTSELEALVVDHPLRERYWGQLMLAHYRAGRQSESLQAYHDARERLVGELGIEPGLELRQLQAAILRQDPGLLRGDPAPRPDPAPPAPAPAGRREPPPLPARLTSLIGRDQELAETAKLLETASLVTVTGPGGVGKSRLALEVAARYQLRHPDATWLVELAGFTDPSLIAPTVAAVLGVREHPERDLVDLIAERLRGVEGLLVLDNCEHLLDGVAEVVHRLLSACPGLRVLITGREHLGVTGEVLRPLSGLSLAEEGATSPAVVGHAAAARLFEERATAVQPGFALSAATAGAVAQICRRLDGLPLAIELAAARMNALGVDQIAARLDDRFGLLNRGSRSALPRHQTLRSVVEWSYDLLEEPERLLFDRLAVFADGFTLEAAEAVCRDPDGDRDGGGTLAGAAVSGLLWRLVDKSLVTTETAGSPTHRYRLLETLRMYGLGRLGERGESDLLRSRHAAFYLALAETARDATRGPDQPAWLESLEAEHGNLRAALARSLEQGRAETAVRLASSLYRFWDVRGHYGEGRRWLSRTLAMPGPVPPQSRARALVDLAQLAVLQGDVKYGVAACEEAEALCREAADFAGLARALQYLGFAAVFAGEPERAAAPLEEALALARAGGGDDRLEGWSWLVLAIAAVADALPDRAAALATESEALLRRVGDLEGVAWSLLIRSAAGWRLGDRDAGAPLRESLRTFEHLGMAWGVSLCIMVAGQLTRSRGDWEAAASLLGAAEAMRGSIGAATLPFTRAWVDGAIAEITAAAGPARLERAWQAGRLLPAASAVAEATRLLDAAGPAGPAGPARHRGWKAPGKVSGRSPGEDRPGRA